MISRVLAAVAAVFLTFCPAEGAALRVAPVGFNLTGGTAASTLRIWNEDKRPIAVQVRVFRWFKVDGKERLEPTRDVVASPPITTLKPGTENLVRIVRVKKAPTEGREAYRLVVDQLPDADRKGTGQVEIVVRHSIPVFFSN